MKKCLNCKSVVRENDIYCRNCGCSLQSNTSYVLLNVLSVFLIFGIIFMIILFISSYLVSNNGG